MTVYIKYLQINTGAKLSISPSPAETLWVGSHKINWSPLPIFERYLSPNSFSQKKEYAQARKYDPQDLPAPSPQTQTQQPATYSSPLSTDGTDLFSKKGLFGFGGGSDPSHSQKKSLFHNPHHDYSNKFSTGGFFSGLGPFGPKNAPKIIPPNFSSSVAERRSSSIQPSDSRDYAVPPTSQTPNTTPSPQYRQSSTRNTILVSPPQTIYALSTPGPSISPIVNRLRQMTEWSRSKQNQKPEVSQSSVPKNEGRSPNQNQINSSLERKLHLKKRQREGLGVKPKSTPHKNNIEAIILANDDDDTTEIITGTQLKVQESKDNPRKSRAKPVSVVKRKRRPRGRKISKGLQQKRKSQQKQQQEQQQQQRNIEDQQEVRPQRPYQLERPRNSDHIILHPTNAALLQQPLEFQQRSLARGRNYEVNRKDKQIDLFQSRQDSDVAAAVNHPGPVSFRFGPEDAKVSPYF